MNNSNSQQFAIVATCNGYNANRKSGYSFYNAKQNAYKVLEEGLSYEEAQEELLNRAMIMSDSFADNWEAMEQDGVEYSHNQGCLPSFSYDVENVHIMTMEELEEIRE